MWEDSNDLLPLDESLDSKSISSIGRLQRPRWDGRTRVAYHRRGSWKAESAQKIKNAFIAYSSSTSNSIHSEKNPGPKYWFLTQLFKVKDVDQGWSKATTAKIVNGQRSNVDQNSQPLMVIPSNIPTNIHTMGVCWVNAHPSYLWPALSHNLRLGRFKHIRSSRLWDHDMKICLDIL